MIFSRKDCADLAEKEDIAMNNRDFGKALELFDELNLVLYLYRACEASRGAAHAVLVEGGDQDTCSLCTKKSVAMPCKKLSTKSHSGGGSLALATFFCTPEPCLQLFLAYQPQSIQQLGGMHY